MAFAFDTLAYTRRLRDGGIPAEAAEVHADAAREFIMTEVATKSDLEVLRRELETSFSHRFDRLEMSLANHVQRLETTIATQVQRLETTIATQVQRLESADTAIRRDMGAALKSLEDRMTVKMGVMLATAIAILAAIIKL